MKSKIMKPKNDFTVTAHTVSPQKKKQKSQSAHQSFEKRIALPT
ncbi:hypothetical protein [Bacteroides pyogenes]|nr:hypothetical protein [Bacteroides pyogenes]